MLKNLSIKVQLIVYLTLATIVIVSFGGLFAYLKLKDEAHRLFDSELIQSAQILSALITTKSKQDNFSALQHNLNIHHEMLEHRTALKSSNPEQHEIEDEHRIGFQVWSKDHQLLLKSTDFPRHRIAQQKLDFSNQIIDGESWRIFSMNSLDGQFTIITGEKLKARLSLMEEAGEGFTQLFFGSFITLLLMLYLALLYAFKPIQQLINHIKEQDINHLSPFKPLSHSQEINHITDSLNQLIDKVKQAINHEKQLTSDAAHQLRTPLAGIKIHAELALVSNNTVEKDESIHKLLEGVNRSTQMVNQLLLLAKIQSKEQSHNKTSIDLSTIIQSEIGAQTSIIESKQINVSCHMSPQVILAEPDKISLVIQNILSNAIKFSPTQGKIDIQLTPNNNDVTLQVMDNGPGIKESDRNKVTQRFYRADDTQHIEGSGIGLSIVKNILEEMDATLEFLDSDFASGLKVIVKISPSQ